MTRFLAALVALLALSACSAGTAPSPSPTSPAPSSAVVSVAPDGGVLLSSMGVKNAPAGFSIPDTAVVAETIDAANNVTLVLTQPDGDEIAAYLREHLAGMGFEITADGEGSLLFESPTHAGAFTSTDDLSALSLRTDQRS